MDRASGLSSRTLLIAGPFLSISWMRAEYFSTRDQSVNLPDFIPSCRPSMVISSSSKGLVSGAGAVGVTSRAAPSAGYRGVMVAAALPIRVVLRNERRSAAGFASFRGMVGKSLVASGYWQIATEHSNSWGTTLQNHGPGKRGRPLREFG